MARKKGPRSICHSPYITDEMMRNALTVRTGVISEMSSTLIRAPSVFLQRAVVGGTDIEITAVQDDTGAVARVRSDGQGGKIDIQSDEGTRTNAYANVMSHSWSGSNYGARWETVEFEPTVLLGKTVRIGGDSEIRGTIVN